MKASKERLQQMTQQALENNPEIKAMDHG